MANKNTKRSTDRRAAKRAAVLGTEKKSRLPLVICLTLIVAAPAGAWLIINSAGSDVVSAGATAASSAGPSAAGDGFVTHPVALFDDGKARHFTHSDGKATIRYFVLKSSDGIIRAAFDACDVCWPADKGYVQDGDVMICRNCGRRFASVRINEVQGGCNPAPLKRTIDGDRLVLQVKDILEGRPYFDIKGKA